MVQRAGREAAMAEALAEALTYRCVLDITATRSGGNSCEFSVYVLKDCVRICSEFLTTFSSKVLMNWADFSGIFTHLLLNF